jgi:hypothetical protein
MGADGPDAGAEVGASAATGTTEHPRAEMGDAPPFLSWRAIYLIVLGALAVEVALGAVLTVLYR